MRRIVAISIALSLASCAANNSRLARRFDIPPERAVLPFTGPEGVLWLDETSDGIAVLAKIDAKFTSPSIALTVRFANTVNMPPIAWVNQHGKSTCHDIAPDRTVDLASCLAWEKDQLRYRENLVRAFERRWVLNSGSSMETPASRLLPSLHVVDLPGGTGFEIPLRWEQLPPANSLHLSRLYISLVVSAGQTARASIPPAVIGLPRPIDTRWTTCAYPLDDFSAVMPEEDEEPAFPGWYFLNGAGIVSDAFVLKNVPEGYQYLPHRPSPEAQWTKRFSGKISADEEICWPDLRYKVGRTDALEPYADAVDPTLRTHRLPDGSLLLTFGPQVGPLSELGSGQCGNCPNVTYGILHLVREKDPEEVFLSEGTLGGPDGLQDIEIQKSADWRTITVYRNISESGFDLGNGKWSSERFCLDDATYQACGPGPAGPPPEPRQTPLK